ADGHILNTKFVDAVIHSRAKLSYEQAQAILDGKAAPEGSDPTLSGSVKEAWKMASLLRKNRFLNGALDLEMPEIKIKLDENGRACDGKAAEGGANGEDAGASDEPSLGHFLLGLCLALGARVALGGSHG
ncbi:MAG: RNB domain-containing ribonuclease, partial [Akkermansiaceae bacterium]